MLRKVPLLATHPLQLSWWLGSCKMTNKQLRPPQPALARTEIKPYPLNLAALSSEVSRHQGAVAALAAVVVKPMTSEAGT